MGRNKAPEFKDFWKAYPLHKGKIEAERAWNRLSAGDKQKALAGIASYRVYCEHTGVAFKYPQGWLNGHRWEDEYEETVTKKELFQTSKPKLDASMLGQMNMRGKADGLTATATDGPADTLSGMETW